MAAREATRGAGAILITGGSSWVGEQVALVLAAAGVTARLWLAPGAVTPPVVRAGWAHGERADAWNYASLRGRGRGVQLLLHCVGSLQTDASRGLSAQQLNLAAARNVINMAVQDGVPQFLLLSSAGAPWLPRDYLAAKRAAEQFLARSGMRQAIVRAPLAFEKGGRPFLFRFLSALAWLPLLGNGSPMPRLQLARGVAQLALQLLREEADTSGPVGSHRGRIYRGRDLRRLARDAPELLRALRPAPEPEEEALPFGWNPP